MRVTPIRFRFRQGLAIHLFPDGMFDNIPRHFHKIALRGRAFRHAPMMPRIHFCRITCGKDTNPLRAALATGVTIGAGFAYWGLGQTAPLWFLAFES